MFSEDLITYILSLQNFSTICKKRETKITKKNFFRSDRKKSYKEVNGNIITIACKINFLNSARFMKTSLSNLVNNLVERIHRLKLNVVIVFLNMKESRIIL